MRKLVCMFFRCCCPHKNQHRWKSNELGYEERLDQDARAAPLGYYGSLLRSWSERFVALAIALFSIILARPYLTFEGFRLSSSFVMALGIYAAIRTIWHGALAEHVLHVPLSQTSLRAQEMGEAKSYLDRLDQDMKNGYKRQRKIRYNIMDYSGRSPYWFFLILAIALVLYFVWPLWGSLFMRDPF